MNIQQIYSGGEAGTILLTLTIFGKTEGKKRTKFNKNEELFQCFSKTQGKSLLKKY
jgi:hypothetical protein